MPCAAVLQATCSARRAMRCAAHACRLRPLPAHLLVRVRPPPLLRQRKGRPWKRSRQPQVSVSPTCTQPSRCAPSEQLLAAPWTGCVGNAGSQPHPSAAAVRCGSGCSGAAAAVWHTPVRTRLVVLSLVLVVLLHSLQDSAGLGLAPAEHAPLAAPHPVPGCS